uniref:Uncharacterized protein n=1 Tax=Brassica oleracea var. oleracea TaxID=109376 RepID=A0A0D3CHD7_BRAOL
MNNTPLLGFVIFFSLRHQKLSSPFSDKINGVSSSDASPPLFKCGCSGFRRSGKLMGVDMLYWIQRLLCFEACVHNYLNFFGLLNPHCQAFLFRVLFNIF